MGNPDETGEYESHDDILERRRAKRAAEKRRNLTIALACGAVAVFVAVVAVGAAGFWLLAGRPPAPVAQPSDPSPLPGVLQNAPRAAPAGLVPSADREGVSWTHKELLAYQNAKGMNLGMRPAGDSPIGPAAYFYRRNARFVTEQGDGAGVVDLQFETNGPDVLLVVIARSAPQARDEAGVHGDQGAAWGRFLFRSTTLSKPLMGGVQAALR